MNNDLTPFQRIILVAIGIFFAVLCIYFVTQTGETP